MTGAKDLLPPVANTLAGDSVAQPGVIAERWGVEASNCGSAIGEEGSETSTLLFGMPLLFSDVGRGLALRMSAAVRSLRMAMALAERLNASMSSSITLGHIQPSFRTVGLTS
jgi:hypothetical protein